MRQTQSIYQLALGVGAAFLFCFSPTCIAGFYFDLSATGGYSHTSVDSGEQVPVLASFGGGATYAYWLTSSIFVGAMSDYRVVNEYSNVNTRVGNLNGTRWNILSPTIGFRIKFVFIKADFQFLGAYHIPYNTAGGLSNLAYESPIGGRLTLLPANARTFQLGGFVEYVKFRSSNFSLEPRTFVQIGATLTLGIMGGQK